MKVERVETIHLHNKLQHLLKDRRVESWQGNMGNKGNKGNKCNLSNKCNMSNQLERNLENQLHRGLRVSALALKGNTG